VTEKGKDTGGRRGYIYIYIYEGIIMKATSVEEEGEG
jgi:hypothetical protein